MKPVSMMVCAVLLSGCTLVIPEKNKVTAAGSSPELTSASLTTVPTARQMGNFYPAEAKQARQAGRAVIRCKVPVSGLLDDCKVVSETSPAFGIATLRLAPFFRVDPEKLSGKLVEGMITIPVVWKIGS